MAHLPHFSLLSKQLSTVYDTSNLNIEAFQTTPIVLQSPLLRQMAFSLSPMPGYALEFGVFRGSSIRQLALANPRQHFYGFDSFEGLPEPWRLSPDNTYPAGHFAVPRLPYVPENVTLTRGFFDQTLRPWLEKNPGPVGFVHIDCDLYGGAKTILAALADRLLPGAIIVFDELGDWEHKGIYPNWAEGEWRALQEWLAETDMRIRILARGVKYQAVIQVWRKPPGHDLPQTLTRIKAVWDCGAIPLAKTLIDTVWEESTPWIPAAHLSLSWDDCALPQRTIDRVARIWAQAMEDPNSDLVVDLHLVRARIYFKTGQLQKASWRIRDFLNARPCAVPGIRLAIDIANAARDFERAESLSRRWNMLTGNPEAAKSHENYTRLTEIRTEFRFLQCSGLLVQHLLDTRQFQTVLDIGSGSGEHARVFRAAGKHVTEIDYGRSIYAAVHPEEEKLNLIVGDFMDEDFDHEFDCVFASHVLEHQKNVHDFLVKIHSLLKEGGVLGLSVPPMKPQIVGGHLTLWNAGLLLYNLVLAGFDCRQAWVRSYGYNISIALEKKSITPQGLVYDNGDIDRLSAFLPEGLAEGFNGDIHNLG